MKNLFPITLIILLLSQILSCHPDQYFLSYHFPSAAIKNDSRAYMALMPGLRVYTVKNYKEKLIGMVGSVRYEKDSVVVDIMLDKKIPVGSKIRLYACAMPNMVISLAKGHKYYHPGKTVNGTLSLEKDCQ